MLPEGRALPEAEWRRRHKILLWTIAAHAVGLTIFGLYNDWHPGFAFGEGILIAVLGALAALPLVGRRFRSATAALALVTSSAVLVQFSARYGSGTGGFIEAHFHYFVVIAAIAMYEDWVPFLLGVFYVALDHGVIGTIFPEWVYNHPDAIAHPWKWAVIHAAFVLAECAALIAVWRASEQARARSELILRSTGEGLLGVDLDGRVTFANPAAVAMAGRSESELLGTAVDSLISPSPVLPTSAPATVAAQAAWKRSEKDSFPVEVVATPMMFHGEVQGSVLAVKDITERKHAEQEHARRVEHEREIKRLREEATFKTLFMNTAAHELRTPLTPLKLQLHVLRGEKRGGLNEEQRRITGILGRNLDRLARLVEDVLDVGRLQANRVRLEPEAMDLRQAVTDAVEAFQEVAKQNGVKLQATAPADVTMEADARRIGQILFNLIENGLKFTPAGGQVRVEANAEGDTIRIDVKDTGIGMTTAAMATLFQPFIQAHDPMEQTRSGSGLGLYISRGFAQLHGGTLECRSEGPGKGTTFTLRIPRTQESQSDKARSTS
jgi:PAS domain S-box-containing protein